ncbi:hypothetical protein R4I06_03760 [Anaplasma bovis]
MVGVVRKVASDGVLLDKVAYDIRSRIYICYLLCTSIVSLVPIIPYVISKEAYKKRHKLWAAISVQIFRHTRTVLVFGLLFTKAFTFILEKYPNFLGPNFFIKNKDLAILFLAMSCTLPLLVIESVFHYLNVYDEVTKNKCSVSDVLISQSFLGDISCGLPALLCYQERTGPLGIKSKNTNYWSDVVYEVYLYCTSYILVVPGCCALLAEYLRRKDKKVALYVVKMLAVSSHVILINSIFIGMILYWILSSCGKFLHVGKANALDSHVSMAFIYGIFISSFIFLLAMAFFYYEISTVNSKKTDITNSLEVSDEIAGLVLKFGLLTVAVSSICSLFRTKTKLREKCIKYPKTEFAYDLVRRIVGAVLVLPACFLQLSELCVNRGNKKFAAIASRARLFSEIFLGNVLCFFIASTAIFCTPAARKALNLASPTVIAFASAVALACVVEVAAVLADLFFTSKEIAYSGKEYVSVVLRDKELDYKISKFGIINLISSAIIHVAYDKGSQRGTANISADAKHSDISDMMSSVISPMAVASVYRSRSV